ncbi:MAG: hypothetical protein KKD39_06525, partial [Candidatus Altiarchaeota archaeon]|nr:hypothetical protein [Candidatus Altiarchaeota archaeon]
MDYMKISPFSARKTNASKKNISKKKVFFILIFLLLSFFAKLYISTYIDPRLTGDERDYVQSEEYFLER